MYCTTNQFPELICFGPHNKPHGACWLGNYYNMCFDPKLGHDTNAILCITCAHNKWTSILDKLCTTCLPPHKQPCYQHVKDCACWHVLGSFNNCNIINFSHKSTSSEDIDKINQVALDIISDNMAELMQTGQYGSNNKNVLLQWDIMLSNYFKKPT